MSAALLVLPYCCATVLYVVGMGSHWFIFKDVRLQEEGAKASQSSVQSSSLDGPVDER